MSTTGDLRRTQLELDLRALVIRARRCRRITARFRSEDEPTEYDCWHQDIDELLDELGTFDRFSQGKRSLRE